MGYSDFTSARLSTEFGVDFLGSRYFRRLSPSNPASGSPNMQLENQVFTFDTGYYLINDLPRLLGVLQHIVDRTKPQG